MARSEKIGHTSAKPIDKTALKVVLPGYKYMSPKVVQTQESDAPYKLRWPTKRMKRNKDFEDLRGQQRGRLRVLGLAADHNGMWACRCACGKYVLRLAKALKNPNNEVDRCEQCRQLVHQKNKDHWRRTGEDREHDE